MERKSWQQIQNQIQCRRKKEDREEKRGKRRKKRGPVGQMKEEMLMSVAWPSNLLSSPLSMWLLISLSLSLLCWGARGSASIPLILCLICQFKWRLGPVMMLRRLTTPRKCRSSFATSWPPHPDNFLYKKNLPASRSILQWIKLGGHTSLSLIGLFAGTLLNVNFAKGVCLCRWF